LNRYLDVDIFDRLVVAYKPVKPQLVFTI